MEQIMKALSIAFSSAWKFEKLQIVFIAHSYRYIEILQIQMGLDCPYRTGLSMISQMWPSPIWFPWYIASHLHFTTLQHQISTFNKMHLPLLIQPAMRVHAAYQHLFIEPAPPSPSEGELEILGISTQIIFLQNNRIHCLLNHNASLTIQWHHLIELDLSSNHLTALPKHECFWKYFPMLQVLFLQHNRLESLWNIVESLQFIGHQIRVLSIDHNPFCQTDRHYASKFIRMMPQLLLLDNYLVSDAERDGLYQRGQNQLCSITIDALRFAFVSHQNHCDNEAHLWILQNQLKNLAKQQKNCGFATRIQRTWRKYKS